MSTRRTVPDTGDIGRIDAARLESFTEEEIERMAKEDGEDAWFETEARADRVARPRKAARRRPKQVVAP